MPSTPTYGLPFEAPGDLPGHTLDGGPAGDQLILAEAVEAELSRVDGDVAGLDMRLTTVENQGAPSWVRIAQGAESNVATFVIPSIPTGAYRSVRLTLLGNADTASNPIRVRFNGDATADLHRSGLLVWDATGSIIINQFVDGTFWHIAQWGTGLGSLAVVEIHGTDVSTACGFVAWGSRIGGSAETHTTS